MKKLIIAFLLFGLLGKTSNSFSQGSSKIDMFLKKIENTLQKLDSASIVADYQHKRGFRKNTVIGSFKSQGKYFEQTTRFYRGGLKKEQTTVYQNFADKKIPILIIVKFNDKVHLIQYFEVVQNPVVIVVTKDEKLIENQYFRSTTYDPNGRVIKVESEVNICVK